MIEIQLLSQENMNKKSLGIKLSLLDGLITEKYLSNFPKIPSKEKLNSLSTPDDAALNGGNDIILNSIKIPPVIF